MKKLLEYLVKGITGLKDIEVKEEVDGDFLSFTILTAPETAGLIIGKQGKTIKTIKNLLRVKATLDKKGVSISVEEKEK